MNMGEKNPERRVPERQATPQKDRRADLAKASGKTAANGPQNDKNKKLSFPNYAVVIATAMPDAQLAPSHPRRVSRCCRIGATASWIPLSRLFATAYLLCDLARKAAVSC